jgi:D-glycero-D-manno-heptose 1,7-bisphosphate phosphatase
MPIRLKGAYIYPENTAVGHYAALVRSPVKHVIVDRDGVLNIDRPGGYICAPDQWQWMPNALEALFRISRAGIRLSVATNQSCVGRGIIDQRILDAVHSRMEQEANSRGIFFSGVHVCPHAPWEGCSCRKPAPGLICRAVFESGVAKEHTIFIGDSETDLKAGLAAGVRSWLVRTGKGMQTEETLEKGGTGFVNMPTPRIFDDLAAAAGAIAGGFEEKGGRVP